MAYGLGFPDIVEGLRAPGALGPMLLTLKVLCVAAPLLAVFGVGAGYALGRWRGRASALVDFAVTAPLVFPPIATGFLLLLVLGRRGIIGGFLSRDLGFDVIFSFWGVVLAAFIAGLPLIVKPVQAAVKGDTGRLIEAAYVLGKSPLTTFFKVTLPSIRRGAAIGMFLAVARAMGEVGVTLMLGGNIVGKTNTISLEIYNAVFTGEYDRALALTLVLGAASLVLLLATRRLSAE